MTSLRKRWALGLAVLVMLPGVASAGPEPQLNLANRTGEEQATITLEPYNVWPWPADPAQRVIDPTTGCFWDINERGIYSSTGSLAPGTSASTELCVIEYFQPRYVARNGNLAWYSGPSPWFGAQVLAQSSGLTVTTCFQPQGRCFTLTPVVVDRKTWSYSGCQQIVYLPDDPALVEIPGSTPDPLPWGSTAGRGVRTTITLTIANPTGSLVRGVLARWGESSDVSFPRGCTQQAPPTTSEYPFRYYRIPGI